MRYCVTFETTMGWVGILGSEKGLLATTLPQPSPERVLWQLGSTTERVEQAASRFASLVQRLTAYFNGLRVVFPDILDLSGATLFQIQVWQQARLIPYGETRSYGWVAEQIGKPGAARAVGQAMGRNPLPVIVPCHRVVGSGGRLGGFGGGLDLKKRMLGLEGISIR